jgi:ectoine hydroxylase-related dioxygenase (phytanoyl-CoA dioxygenase family)
LLGLFVAEFANLKSDIAERGFSILPDAFSAVSIDRLEKGLREAPLPRSRAGIRHALRHPAVLEVSRSPTLLGVARAILGNGAFPFRATLFDKSPSSNWLVVWHQDTALPPRARKDVAEWGPWSIKDGVIYAHGPERALSRVVALRLHLDDSVRENGPLRVLPGTHTMGVLDDNAIRDLSNRMSPVDCLVPLGGILVMRPLIVHASSKSKSETPRRVLHIEYAASAELADGLELAVS